MNEKINIGLFIDTFYPMIDGVITVVDNYAKRLAQVANVTVFAPKPRKPYNDAQLGYKVVRCKRLKVVGLDYDLPMPQFDKKFKKSIKDANLDIIHIHSPFTIGTMGAKYGKKHNIPVIATMHSQFKQDFYKATKSKLITKVLLKKVAKTFNMADLLLTMNPACENLAKEYGYNGKIKLLPNATDLINSADIKTLSKEIKQKYSLTDKEKIFINIGRLNKLKNIDFVIDVCAILKSKGFDFKLFLIGGGKDEAFFKLRVKELNLENEIIFVGKVYDKNLKSAYYCSSDLHVFPSFYDTDGIVKIEAAAFNVPTIFIKGSIASSTCKDNIDGYVSENNANIFANKIIDIFNDKNRYEKVKEQCYNNVYITWDKVVDHLQKIYNDLIKEKKI